MITNCLLCGVRQIKARGGGGVGAGEHLRSLPRLRTHEKCPGWTLPGHVVTPYLRQGVGLLPLSIYEGEAAEPRLLAAARGEG